MCIFLQPERTTEDGVTFYANLGEYDTGTMNKKQIIIYNKGINIINKEDDCMKVCLRAKEDSRFVDHDLGNETFSPPLRMFGKLLCFIPMLMSVCAYQGGAYIDSMTTMIGEQDPDIFVGYLEPNFENIYLLCLCFPNLVPNIL